MKVQSRLTAVLVGTALFTAAHGGEALAQTVAVATGTPGKVHLLPATMENTQLGWYDNAQKPVLTVNSGDTVVMETMMHFHDRLVPGGPALDELLKVRQEFPGRGAHTLSGPIYVEGAEPGDVLKVRINRIVQAIVMRNRIAPPMVPTSMYGTALAGKAAAGPAASAARAGRAAPVCAQV